MAVERVDLGDGSCMRLERMGEGSPTILLDAGWGHWSAIWALVQPKLAERFTTVSFDHMGLGGSDPGPWPRSSFQIVDEMQGALACAGVTGPYLYVAHAFSAVHARTFAYRQQDVIGMVLVDPVVEALGASKYFRQLRDDIDRRYARQLAPARVGMLAAKHFFFPPAFAKRLPAPALREFRYGYKPDVLKSIRGELAALDESLRQLGGLGTPKVPFEVLSSSEDWLPGTKSTEGETRVQVIHRKFASAVRGGSHRVVPDTGHDIHLDAPEAILESVDALLARA
jgi:pimeloyl-ACP methyl ester carboxylesterase